MRLTRCLAAHVFAGVLLATASALALARGLVEPMPALLREGTIHVALRTIAGGWSRRAREPSLPDAGAG